jgi:hypothetical protein
MFPGLQMPCEPVYNAILVYCITLYKSCVWHFVQDFMVLAILGLWFILTGTEGKPVTKIFMFCYFQHRETIYFSYAY